MTHKILLMATCALLSLVGCSRNGPADDEQSSKTESPPGASEKGGGDEGAAGGEGDPWPAELPRDYRQCESDDDCAVAPSLAGLDHPPREGERCQGTCYVGVRRGALEAWKAVVKKRAGQVPCDKEFEECPPEDAFRAACSWGRCKASYVGAGRTPASPRL